MYANLSQFKLFLYSTKPHLVCLCETWIQDSRLPSFVNYTSFFVSRPQRVGGGLAILARNDLSIIERPLVLFPEGLLEVQVVTVCGSFSQLDILNLYNPSQSISSEEFHHYFDQLASPCMVVGDFNAHHELWSSRSHSNATGNNLVSALFNNPDLCLLTPQNLNTYYHVPTRSYSTLDLCFLSSELFLVSDLVMQGDLGGDHVPLQITMNFAPVTVSRVSIKRWKFKEDNGWSHWRSMLSPATPYADISMNYKAFSDNLLKASHEVFQLSSGTSNPKFSKVWWTAECARLINDRHRAKNLFRSHPTHSNLLSLRRSEALVKGAVRRAKRSSFRQFCGVLTYQTPTTVIWN